MSTETADGAGRAFVALEDVELLALRAAAAPYADEGADAAAGATAGAALGATALATLRVTPRQAVYLTAAANFAHEVRLLLRPPGDRRRVGAAEVGEAQL